MDHVPNSTILNIIRTIDFTSKLRGRLLGWRGRVFIMEEGRLLEDFLYEEFPEAQRKHCSPLLRYKDEVKGVLSAFSMPFTT